MSITFSGTSTTTQVLSNPTTDNPATVTSTGLIDVDSPTAGAAGIFGSSGFAWTIANRGTVQSTGSVGIGVNLQSGGFVTNGKSGSPSALIEGSGTGVLIAGGAGTVVNFGTIAGDGTVFPYAGVTLYAGGRVTNAAGGVITGNASGVTVGGGGTIDNQGAVTGGVSGVFLFGGGKVLNRADGLISGGLRGVDVRNGGSGSVANFGTIQGGAGGGVYLGQYLLGSSTVTNGSAASTAALITTPNGTGVTIAIVAGTVTNFGTIDGGTLGVQLNNGGTVTNGSAGSTAALIIGRNAEGVRIGSVAGTVTNFGTIATTATSSAGIQLDFGGNITNGASASTAASIIASNLSGIYVSNLAGTVTNFGSIGGFFGGVRLSAGGIIANKASGSITASNQGVGIYVGVAAGTVTNLGTISGSDGIGLGAGGTITNGSTASTTALIASSPSGTAVVLGTAGGTVTNFGSISGGYYGVLLLGGGKVTNQLGASITGRAGVFANDTAPGAITLTNAGTITGTGGTAVQLGAGNDKVIVQSGAVFNGVVLGDTGTDTISFTQAGAISLAGFAGFETIQLSSAGVNTVALADANFANVTGTSIHVFGGAAGNTVTASALTGLNRLVFSGGAGADHATGGVGNDQFIFSAANLTGADTVAGGGGADQLKLTTAGAIAESGVSGVETFMLSSAGANTLALTNGNFTGVSGASIHVFGGAAGNTVNASAVTGPNRLVFTGGAGADHATGGAGNDQFIFSAANLTGADTAAGGGGADQLKLTTAGTIAANGVSGVETFTLSSAGANTLTLADTNFTGVNGASIHVFGGAAGNTVNASALTGANRLVFTAGAGTDAVTGGTGNDILFAGGNTTMTGGAGANRFTFDDIGSNSITDFAASAGNRIVLRDSGFDLGVDEGLGTGAPQHLDASVFTANPTGAFTTTGQRFAYNTITGRLRYDADGSGAVFSPGSVAVLTGHPSLAAGAAGQVFFTT